MKNEKRILDKKEKEKQIVDLMIALYCKKQHGGNRTEKGLCTECQKLRDYAELRIEKCPFMETKTFCSNCKVHCYQMPMQKKIKEVMRFSGPRMMLYHPVMAIRHLICSSMEKRKQAGKGKSL